MEAISKELSPDLATVDGLDELFEAVSSHVIPVTTDKDLDMDATADSTLLWTLQETAENLGLSTRTVLRRLKTGAIHGCKIMGINGPEWRIKPQDSLAMTNGPVTPSVKTVIGDNVSPPANGYDTYVVDLNKQLLQQVQALAYRNGQLETQLSQRETDLDERDQKIKLLTDSQHKAGWWARFSSWFLGKPNIV